MQEPKELREEALEEIGGGFIGTAPAEGGYEAPIVLDTEEKVRAFTNAASQCSFAVSVRDPDSRHADGKDFEQVLALNRRAFVTVFVVCPLDDPFRNVINRYMDF